MNNRKFRYRIATLLSVLALLTAGCNDDTTENTAQRDRLVTDLLVPGSTFYTSTTKELTIQGKGFAEGDALALADVATGAEIPAHAQGDRPRLRHLRRAAGDPYGLLPPRRAPQGGRARCWASSNSARSTSKSPRRRA